MKPLEEHSGKVYLVGAGPGDPKLLTLRGHEVLRSADIVVYDYLADTSLLGFARQGAELIDVGKRPNRPMAQEEINAILVDAARRFDKVVRLKGGDPMLFGRGAEELEALRAAGISFEVVPGVPSAIAVPTYGGIPLTHRGLSTSLTVITGHRQGDGADDTDYDALARLGGTIVVLMGVGHRAQIAAKLIASGMSPATPVAAVRWGTRPEQESYRGELGNLGEMPVRSPATIVIGEVARFDYDFFESRPLFGKRIIVTRAQSQAGGLSESLSELGARVISAPAISIVPPDDGYGALDRAIVNISEFAYIVFTSSNGAEVFLDRCSDYRVLSGIKIAAVGSATADAIRARHLGVDLIGERFVAEGLLEAFPAGSGAVLIPQAKIARDVLAEGLALKGYSPQVVQAYQTLPFAPSLSEINDVGSADAICFTSSSTVRNFVEIYGRDRVPPTVVSIGPITTATANEMGISVTATAQVHDLDGLVAALVAVFGSNAVPGVRRPIS